MWMPITKEWQLPSPSFTGIWKAVFRRGSRGGEMGEFSPPFPEPPSFFFFSYPSNIEIKFDFSDFSDWGGENSPPISKSWICAWS